MVYKVSHFPISILAFIVNCILNVGHSDWDMMKSSNNFNLYFMILEHVENLEMLPGHCHDLFYSDSLKH